MVEKRGAACCCYYGKSMLRDIYAALCSIRYSATILVYFVSFGNNRRGCFYSKYMCCTFSDYFRDEHDTVC